MITDSSRAPPGDPCPAAWHMMRGDAPVAGIVGELPSPAPMATPEPSRPRQCLLGGRHDMAAYRLSFARR